ncbi:DUF6415 family natural product biosynthesis protein [Streptomyces chartreusis]
MEGWMPPHRREDLERVLERLRAGLPVDAAYDDLNAVLGGGSMPKEDEIEELTERFRGNLMILVDHVLEREAGTTEERTPLVERARMLRQAEPEAGVTPLAFLRRLALTAESLLELLLPDEESAA